MGSNRSGTGTGGTTTKCSFSLNTEVLSDLKEVADNIGVTRSAFLSLLLAESLPQLKIASRVLKSGVEDPIEVAQRISDKQRDILNARISELRRSKDGRKPS